MVKCNSKKFGSFLEFDIQSAYPQGFSEFPFPLPRKHHRVSFSGAESQIIFAAPFFHGPQASLRDIPEGVGIEAAGHEKQIVRETLEVAW